MGYLLAQVAAQREFVRCIVCLDTDESALRREGKGQMAAVLRASTMQMALEGWRPRSSRKNH